MTGSVYIIRNEIDGKQYVGQTWNTLEERWKGHCDLGPKNNCRKLKNAIKKYRFESFRTMLLCECSSQKELNDWEDFFILFFDTLGSNGYNLRRGGSHGRLSDESKMKMSEAHRGRPLFEEHRKAIAVGSIGKKLSMECREKIRLANLGKRASDETREKYCQRRHSDVTKIKMSRSQSLRRRREREAIGPWHS